MRGEHRGGGEHQLSIPLVLMSRERELRLTSTESNGVLGCDHILGLKRVADRYLHIYFLATSDSLSIIGVYKGSTLEYSSWPENSTPNSGHAKYGSQTNYQRLRLVGAVSEPSIL